jgi:hypothetical protein
MGALDPRLTGALDEIVPPRPGPDRWEAIVGTARTPQRARRRWLIRVAPVGAVAVAALVLTLAWPFGGGPQGTIVERAAAAIGDGPVLHVVFEDDWGGTLIDLGTGERRELHGEREVWYDAGRGLHAISRFAGVVQGDVLYAPDEVARYESKTFALLGEDYRKALQSGRARDLGPGEAYGKPVYWIRVDAEWLPDVADGKLREWAHDVGVSRTTFEPVATRETRDGKPGPDTGARILRLETLPAGDGNFSAGERESRDGAAVREGREPITREDAAAALGRRPLWLGPDYVGLPLAQVYKTTKAKGRQGETKLSGSAAADAKACRAYVRRNGTRAGAACERMRRAGRSLLIRGDKVYELGPVVWDKPHTGVELFYGTVGDDPSTYRKDQAPLWDRPHLQLTETTYRDDARGSWYLPPEGSILLTGGPSGFLVADGVYISIAASSEELVLSGARALKAMPAD